jgi:surface antigen Omp85-like protein
MILLSRELLAQSVDTRFDQIQAERQHKSTNVVPTSPATIGSRLAELGSVFNRTPLRVFSNGLGPGAGFAIGAVLEKTSGDRVVSRVWGMEMLHNFYSAGTGTEINTGDFTFALEGSYSNAPQLEYYGPGPNSSIHNQTDYRKEDTLFNFRVDLPATKHITEACRIGELLLNVGPGTNGSLPSTETVFGPFQAPGIDVQSNFLIGGCSAAMDWRDLPEDPHQGTYAAARYDRYLAQDHDRFSFQRVSGVAEQYIPFLNQKRVIALRARTDFSWHAGDQVVPFYLQPTLGNDLELRGFRRYRFYDENSMAMTAEYRWEVSTAFDMALFVDSGKVFHRPGQLNFSDMEYSGGFGLRFKNRNSVMARLDTGFSQEGVQVWFRFGKLY